jgi:hypothetical protein
MKNCLCTPKEKWSTKSLFYIVYRNLGLTNLKGLEILFFIAGVSIAGFFTIKLTTAGLKIKLFIVGILLLKGSLYRGFSVGLLLKYTNA